jgi:hypothetical protein
LQPGTLAVNGALELAAQPAAARGSGIDVLVYQTSRVTNQLRGNAYISVAPWPSADGSGGTIPEDVMDAMGSLATTEGEAVCRLCAGCVQAVCVQAV